MKTKQYFIEKLHLEEHIEGGSFTNTYQADYNIQDRNGNTRPSATSIYFLLEAGDFSAFHRLQADEIWYYHYGATFTIYAIDLEGKLHAFKLGSNLDAGEQLQVIVPRGWIFGSRVEKDFGVVGCMVTPGFDYRDFELLKQADLLRDYPQHEQIIREMTRI